MNSRMKKQYLCLLVLLGSILVACNVSPIVAEVEESATVQFLFVMNDGNKYRGTMDNISTAFSVLDNASIKIIAIETPYGAMGMHFNGGNGEYLYAPTYINGTQMNVSKPHYAFWPHYWFNTTATNFHYILNADWFTANAVNPVNHLTFSNTSGVLQFYYNVTGTLQNSNVGFVNGIKFEGTDFAMINSFGAVSPVAYDILDVGFGYHLAFADTIPIPNRMNRFSIGSFNGTYEVYLNGTIKDGSDQVVQTVSSLPYSPSSSYMGIFNNLTVLTPNNQYYNFEFSDVIDAGFDQKFFEIQTTDLSATQTGITTILIGGFDLTSDYTEGTWITLDPKVSQNTIFTPDLDGITPLPDGEIFKVAGVTTTDTTTELETTNETTTTTTCPTCPKNDGSSMTIELITWAFLPVIAFTAVYLIYRRKRK